MLKNQRGQTLVEVLVTLLFIAAGVIALIRFQNYLAYDTSLSQQKADATILATKQLETLRDFQVLNTTSGYTSYQSIASGSSSSTIGNTTYTVTWTVTPYTNPTYKNVSISVSWTDRYSTAQTLRLISNIAGIDPSNSASIM